MKRNEEQLIKAEAHAMKAGLFKTKNALGLLRQQIENLKPAPEPLQKSGIATAAIRADYVREKEEDDILKACKDINPRCGAIAIGKEDIIRYACRRDVLTHCTGEYRIYAFSKYGKILRTAHKFINATLVSIENSFSQ
jgi:hypothetical protein